METADQGGIEMNKEKRRAKMARYRLRFKAREQDRRIRATYRLKFKIEAGDEEE
jgi:hypothetical protein